METGMILGRLDNICVVSCKDCAHKGDCPFEGILLVIGVDDGGCRFGVAKDDKNNSEQADSSNL